jgi:hypothetical protein
MSSGINPLSAFSSSERVRPCFLPTSYYRFIKICARCCMCQVGEHIWSFPEGCAFYFSSNSVYFAITSIYLLWLNLRYFEITSVYILINLRLLWINLSGGRQPNRVKQTAVTICEVPWCVATFVAIIPLCVNVSVTWAQYITPLGQGEGYPWKVIQTSPSCGALFFPLCYGKLYGMLPFFMGNACVKCFASAIWMTLLSSSSYLYDFFHCFVDAQDNWCCCRTGAHSITPR